MSKEEQNKAIVARWITEFWGKALNLTVVDEIAAPDMALHYSLHAPRYGRADIRAFMHDFREAFPDFSFWDTAELIAENDYVVVLMGDLSVANGSKKHLTGISVLKVVDGKITEERGLYDGVPVPAQLGLIKVCRSMTSEPPCA